MKIIFGPLIKSLAGKLMSPLFQGSTLDRNVRVSQIFQCCATAQHSKEFLADR